MSEFVREELTIDGVKPSFTRPASSVSLFRIIPVSANPVTIRRSRIFTIT